MFGLNDNNQQNAVAPADPATVEPDLNAVMPVPDLAAAAPNPIADGGAPPLPATPAEPAAPADPAAPTPPSDGGVPPIAPVEATDAPVDDSVNGMAAPIAAPDQPDLPEISSNYDSKPAPAPLGGPAEDELLEIKQKALESLAPLVDELDQTPEEKFKTTMMLIQASDNADLVKEAFAAANAIADEKARAQALLDVVNEINYFTQPHDK